MISALHRMRGPAGRRAVIAAGMIGLFLIGMSAAEGTDAGSAQQAPPGATVPTAKLAEVSVSRYASALTTGMRLLAQAAVAGRTVAYKGVQVISWLAPGRGAWLGRRPVAATLNVLHKPGEPPASMLGLTPTLVGLLGSHYVVMYMGPGSAAGRPASIVEVMRPSGSVAALFWLDNATALPLRRELFDDQAQMIGVSGYAGLTVRTQVIHHAASRAQPTVTTTQSPSPPSHPHPLSHRPPHPPSHPPSHPLSHRPPHPPSHPLSHPHPHPLSPPLSRNRLQAGQLAKLRARGWPVPAAMPGGLTLFGASESATTTGPVVDLAYSDGLSVVSLFVQRGKLPATLPGWRPTDLGGQPLFLRNPAEPDLTWSVDGYMYTVVAAAPAATLAGVVDSLPHQTRPGFWARMGNGIRRLLSWADPFR